MWASVPIFLTFNGDLSSGEKFGLAHHLNTQGYEISRARRKRKKVVWGSQVIGQKTTSLITFCGDNGFIVSKELEFPSRGEDGVIHNLEEITDSSSFIRTFGVEEHRRSKITKEEGRNGPKKRKGIATSREQGLVQSQVEDDSFFKCKV